MSTQHTCRLTPQLISQILIFIFLFQNCGTPSIPTVEAPKGNTTNNHQGSAQQTIETKISMPTKIHLGHRINHKEDLPITSIEDIQVIDQANKLITPIITLPVVLESHLSIYSSVNQQQPDDKKENISMSLKAGNSDKLDKGKEKIEEKISDKTEKHLVNQDIKSSSISNFIVLKGINSAESLKNYYKTLFSRVEELESFNKFKSVIYRAIDEDVRLTYDKDAVMFIFDYLHPHIETVLRAKYFEDLSQDDQLKLVNSFYELNLKIAQYSLTEMLNLLRSDNYNYLDIKIYSSKYLAAKKKLHTNFIIPRKLLTKNYLQILNEIYESSIRIVPEVSTYLDPQSTHKNSHQHKGIVSQRRLKIEQKSQAMHTLNLLNLLPDNDCSTSKLYTALIEFSKQILKEDVSSCLQNRGENIEKWRQYTAKFLELEHLAFINSFSLPGNPIYIPNKLELQNLFELYESLYATIPAFNTSIYQFMRIGIIVLTMADQLDLAFIRLLAADMFYISKSHPYDFENFQATAYALCGHYSRLTDLNNSIIKAQLEKKRKIRERKVRQHQKRVVGIKEVRNLQESLKMPSLAAENTEKEQQIRHANVLLEPTGLSDLAYQEQAKLRQEGAEARLIRHQEAEQKRIQKQLFDEQEETEEQPIVKLNHQELEIQGQAQELSHTGSTPGLQFFLPGKAFKTVSNIFNGNWKIKRIDIENLFDVLGQDVDVATKSSHHIITIPQGIALVQEEKIIGLITGLSASMSGHISLPNWEKEVPFYIRPQIQKMLELIGINQENYSKGNREDFMQFMPIKKSTQ